MDVVRRKSQIRKAPPAMSAAGPSTGSLARSSSKTVASTKRRTAAALRSESIKRRAVLQRQIETETVKETKRKQSVVSSSMGEMEFLAGVGYVEAPPPRAPIARVERRGHVQGRGQGRRRGDVPLEEEQSISERRPNRSTSPPFEPPTLSRNDARDKRASTTTLASSAGVITPENPVVSLPSIAGIDTNGRDEQHEAAPRLRLKDGPVAKHPIASVSRGDFGSYADTLNSGHAVPAHDIRFDDQDVTTPRPDASEAINAWLSNGYSQVDQTPTYERLGLSVFEDDYAEGYSSKTTSSSRSSESARTSKARSLKDRAYVPGDKAQDTWKHLASLGVRATLSPTASLHSMATSSAASAASLTPRASHIRSDYFSHPNSITWDDEEDADEGPRAEESVPYTPSIPPTPMESESEAESVRPYGEERPLPDVTALLCVPAKRHGFPYEKDPPGPKEALLARLQRETKWRPRGDPRAHRGECHPHVLNVVEALQCGMRDDDLLVPFPDAL